MTLQEALVKLRHACHEELEVGNGWDLGDGEACSAAVSAHAGVYTPAVVQQQECLWG